MNAIELVFTYTTPPLVLQISRVAHLWTVGTEASKDDTSCIKYGILPAHCGMHGFNGQKNKISFTFSLSSISQLDKNLIFIFKTEQGIAAATTLIRYWAKNKNALKLYVFYIYWFCYN